MKYLKLFEQDAWWRKKSEFDNLVFKDWRLVKIHDGELYYIQTEKIGDKIKLYDTNRLYDSDYFDLNPEVNKNIRVGFLGREIDCHSGLVYWKLPKEIRNRLENGI